MAQPDLLAQKILGTDPETGFGESTVAPYRKHEFDMSGIMELRREKTRQEIAKAERAKDNEDFLNQKIGNLNEYDRAFHGHMDNLRKNVVDTAVAKSRQGVNIKTDPDFMNAFTNYQQDADATRQIVADKNNIMKLTQGDVGKYINLPSYKGAALKNLDEAAHGVNSGDRSFLQKSIAPNLLDPEHFKFDEFIHDKASNVGKYDNANDQVINGGLGQFIKHTEKGYKFYTKDDNGNIIPGVDKSVTDYFLNTPTTDQDTMQFRQVIENLADKHIENKALLLKANDPAYANLGLTRIKEMISTDPKNKNYINKDAYKENVLKQKLEPEQSISEKESLRTSHKYSTGSGSGSEKRDSAIARHESITKMLDGDETENGNLLGAVYGGNKVLGIKINNPRGTIGVNPTGNETGLRGGIVNARANMPGTFTVTTIDSKGREKKKTVDYTDKEDLYYKLNNIYNTAPGQKKVTKEDLDKNRGDEEMVKDEDPFGIYNEDKKEEDIL